MISIYNDKPDRAYNEWLKAYDTYDCRKKRKNKNRQKEHVYYLKQRLAGLVMLICGMIIPLIDGDATVSLFALPLGIFLLFTREKVMIF